MDQNCSFKAMYILQFRFLFNYDNYYVQFRKQELLHYNVFFFFYKHNVIIQIITRYSQNIFVAKKKYYIKK